MEDPLRLTTRTGQGRPVCEQAVPGLLTATAARPERSRPDSAHGFLFQHHAEFAADVCAFLSDAG